MNNASYLFDYSCFIHIRLRSSASRGYTGRYAPDSFGTIEGEITDIFWRNPHVRLLIGRTGDDGVRLDWLAQIADTVNFTEPVVMEGAWTWAPGHEIEPFNCELPEFAN